MLPVQAAIVRSSARAKHGGSGLRPAAGGRHANEAPAGVSRNSPFQSVQRVQRFSSRISTELSLNDTGRVPRHDVRACGRATRAKRALCVVQEGGRWPVSGRGSAATTPAVIPEVIPGSRHPHPPVGDRHGEPVPQRKLVHRPLHRPLMPAAVHAHCTAQVGAEGVWRAARIPHRCKASQLSNKQGARRATFHGSPCRRGNCFPSLVAAHMQPPSPPPHVPSPAWLGRAWP